MLHEHTYVVIGGTGHLGSATAEALLGLGRHVRVVTRSTAKADAWAVRGAESAIADIEDAAAMASALSSPQPVRVFALNPPGSIHADPDADEDRTAAAIVDALAAARVDRVVAISTYGVRRGRRIGDLGTLHRFESLLRGLATPVAILRVAYLYSNWDGAATPARTQGEVPIMLDPDRPLPMVAPADVGRVAARLLTREQPAEGIVHVEGPRRYTPREVAAAFAEAVGSPVATVRTPPQEWTNAFLAAGFSTEAAESFTGLTTLTDGDDWQLDAAPTRGATTLPEYIRALVRNSEGT
ncbi:MAG: NAD(P)H-binding protein [Micropruina sp.]|nr:NAD(P)H-binding protein [Micropruina sp.]